MGVLDTFEIGFSDRYQAGHRSLGIDIGSQNPFLRLENRPIEFDNSIMKPGNNVVVQFALARAHIDFSAKK